jgi:hypothetical protein
MFWRFSGQYGGTLTFLLGLALLPFAWSYGHRWVALAVAAGFVAVLQIPYIHPHYFSPFSSFLVAGFILGARRVTSSDRLGHWARTAVMLGLAAVLLFQIGRRSGRPDHIQPSWATARASIMQALTEQGGRHLVLVRYGEGHSFHEEWVYNPAELSNAKILWARWSAQRNESVAHHYGDRKIWVLDVDRAGPRLEAYRVINKKQTLASGQH